MSEIHELIERVEELVQLTFSQQLYMQHSQYTVQISYEPDPKRYMETDGVEGAAKIVAGIFTSEPERAKDLAYRLFSLFERRGWTSEAFAYNSLVVAWPDVQSRAADLSAAWSNAEQTTFFQEE